MRNHYMMGQTVPFLEKFSTQVNQGIEYLLFGLGLLMALLVAVQVFFRYILNDSLFWSEELARYMLVWLTFLGASAAYYHRLHPGVDMFYQYLPPKLQWACNILIHLTAVSLFAVMVFYGFKFAYFVRMQTTPSLQLPKWTVMSIIPISGMILLLHGITFLANTIQKGR